MPILSTNKEGDGVLYNFTSGANALLTAGTTYFQTLTGNVAFYNGTVTNIHLTVAGTLVAEGSGLYSYGSGTTTVTILDTGNFYGTQYAVYATQRLILSNDGHLTGQVSTATGSTASSSVTNSGSITGTIGLGAGEDRVTNTGTISGDVATYGGADTIDTHLGTLLNGSLFGGTGNDTYIIAGSERIIEDPGGGIDTVRSYGNYRMSAEIEVLYLLGDARTGYGNASDNTITGNDNGNTLLGQGGKDVLTGGAGYDVINGGDGDDSIDGGATGDDRLSGAAGNDTITAGFGDAILAGGAGDDLLYPKGEGAYLLNGGAGTDAVQYTLNDTAIVVDLAAQTVSGGEASDDRLVSIENIFATTYADRITGSSVANSLYGDAGNDTLSGGAGDDTLDGGSGADRLDGGDGIDTITFTLTGSDVSVSLAANKGLAGDALGDVYVSIENVTGSIHDDTLVGSDGANRLDGSKGDDYLNGAQGADTLYGGAGNDTLVGGSDADVFGYKDVFTGFAGGWESDTITLFQNGVDKISFVGASAISSMADLVITQSGADALITDAVGDVIRIVNFAKANLDPTDFIFG